MKSVVGIACLVALVLGGCGGGVARIPEGGVTEAAVISVLDVQTGDCFQDPDFGSPIDQIEVVPCQEPHDNEVFAVVDFPAADGADFPGG